MLEFADPGLALSGEGIQGRVEVDGRWTIEPSSRVHV